MADDIPQEKVEAMAEYYGIKLPEECHMLWIAKQACVEPLPDGWSEFNVRRPPLSPRCSMAGRSGCCAGPGRRRQHVLLQ
eukprot:COSAG04_NODE_24019_length_328_cov_0.903930_1_plen_79_part_01